MGSSGLQRMPHIECTPWLIPFSDQLIHPKNAITAIDMLFVQGLTIFSVLLFAILVSFLNDKYVET